MNLFIRVNPSCRGETPNLSSSTEKKLQVFSNKPLNEVDPSPDEVRLEAEPSLAVPTHPPILPKPRKIVGSSSIFASYFSLFGIIGWWRHGAVLASRWLR